MVTHVEGSATHHQHQHQASEGISGIHPARDAEIDKGCSGRLAAHFIATAKRGRLFLSSLCLFFALLSLFTLLLH